nr:hypothetical protein [uncultured Faecalibacillus sp.]
MQRIIISVNQQDKEKLLHLLEVNRYQVKELINEKGVFFFLEVYDFQMNLLIELIRPYQSQYKIYVLNEIKFY